MKKLSAYISIPALLLLTYGLMGCATPLTKAAGEGNLNEAKRLLDQGDLCRQKPSLSCDYVADPNERDGNGFTPLIMASRYGHTGIAELLIERGADVNKSNYSGAWAPAGMPVVHAACPQGSIPKSEGRRETSWLLVEKGADIDGAMQYIGKMLNYGSWYRTCYESLKIAKLGKPRPLPEEPSFKFTGFEIPERMPAGSVPLTIVVVEPYYAERETGKLAYKYSKALKVFSARVGTSYDELFVAKGLTTRGPYSTLDFIPYPDKKGSNLTFTQTMYIAVGDVKPNIKKGAATYVTKDGNIPAQVHTGILAIEGWIALEMRESLSAEKMWIKKLDLGTVEYEYQRAYKMAYTEVPSGSPYQPATGTWVETNEELFDTSANALSDYLKKAYPAIMQAIWISFSPEEMTLLDKKGEEIRALKVYTTAPR